MTRIIELILTENRVGTGKEFDPIRLNIQLWTKTGELVAERDEEKREEHFNPNFLE